MGAIVDGGDNLRWPSFDTTCVGAFADPDAPWRVSNGGPTETLALLSGSPAIDAGNGAAYAASPVNGVDSRG